MTDLSLHLAPNAPWLALALLTLVLVALGLWAYRFTLPPLAPALRRVLPALRIVAFVLLAWLLAQPVLERAGGGGARLIVLADHSRSMDLPAGVGPELRSAVATRAVAALRRAWRGRATVEVMPFADGLLPDSANAAGTHRGATALGTALDEVARSPAGERTAGVVVVSDGVVNAGDDPVAAARSLGMPVHAVVVGAASGEDRVVGSVESSVAARVGQPTTVRVRIATTESRGVPMTVRLLDQGRELGRASVMAPGGGAEVTAEFHVTPTRPGLAVWTAHVDSLPGERTLENNARQVAVEVAPGRLGVVIVSPGLNWDLAFLRRALLGDSSLSVTTFTRERGGWRQVEHGGRGGAPDAEALRGQAVVVLDAITPAEVGDGFDAALATFVRGGGGLLLFGGAPPGLARYRTGRLAADLALALDAGAIGRAGAPLPALESRELLAWDIDPARGERAWQAAAPLNDVAPAAPGAGDRVLLAAGAGGPPLLFVRRIGRGQALLVNGTGMWRWSLSGADELTAERGRALWRRLLVWLAEPAQGEPLRVRPERWLTPAGEPVRLFATLQDAAFRPVADAAVDGELRDAAGHMRRIAFEPREAGNYVATLDQLPPGRYSLSARAQRGGREVGRSATELAVDRWSLELARTQPDSASLAAMARASGGKATAAGDVERWARSLSARTLAGGRTDSLKLWESPWIFALIIGCLALEWFLRRRRGLP
jgi:hypothetical protein